MRPADNPFRAARISAIRYRLYGETWDGLLSRLAALGWRAAVEGPEGHGKSTLLRELARRLPEAGKAPYLVRRSRSEPTPLSELLSAVPARLAEGDVLLLDAADTLTRVEWLRVRALAARSRCGLVITRHGAGPLPTLVRCAPDESVLSDVVEELLARSAAERVAAGPDRERVARAAAELYRLHGGNMRETLRALYDEAARGAFR